MGLTNPAIKNATRTCYACPEMWEGTLTDGRRFFFRLRYGVARLDVGLSGQHEGEFYGKGPRTQTGHDLQGVFLDDKQRNETFKQLLKLVEC